MTRLLLLLLAVLLGERVASLRVNGWYPCTATASSDDLTSFLFSSVPFECAKVQVPLCHTGICESSKTTEIFVKRKLATVQPATKNVWFLEGGPGASSINMEQAMLLMAGLLNDTVSFYTMDHRGTGRSGFLQCEAAQALADGSPGGANLELGELANCVRDVMFEIDGHTAAYSVTSAARDVVAILEYLEDVAEDPQEESNVFLYGVSYGTYLVERIMHLAPPQVRGYMVDGVLSEVGFSALEWNKNILPPTRRFFEACFDSPKCPIPFKTKSSVMEELRAMYEEIDGSVDSNACAEELMSAMETDTPSDALRLTFALLVRDPWWRTLVPSLLLRVHRCNDADFEELTLAFRVIQERLTSQYGSASSSAQAWPNAWGPADNITSKHQRAFLEISPTSTPSTMLYYLITFSELWQVPMADLDSLQDNFRNGPFSLDIDTLPAYCLLSGGFQDGANVATCNQLRESWEQTGEDLSDLPTLSTNEPFLYEHDQYWNSTATLPDDVGVLLIVGGLDFQTPRELGHREYKSIQSTNKMLVEFAFGGHGCGFMPTSPDDLTGCGPSILASFINNDGDVTRVNTSCLEQLPNLEFDDTAFQELVSEVQELVEQDTETEIESASGSGSMSSSTEGSA